MEIKLKLKIKDVEIELSLEEMKKLKELLCKLTGREVIKEKEYIPYYQHWWYYTPTSPQLQYNDRWFITCGNQTADNITYTATLNTTSQ